MAEGIRTENGERVWVVRRQDDTEGQGARFSGVRPATEDDVAGQGYGHPLGQTEEDTEGQGKYSWIRAEAEDDTVGHPRLRLISPEPLDAEQGLYLAVTDSDEDVTGQGYKIKVESEDTEGQRRQMRESEDAEGQVYRQRGPGGEDGKGSV